jgi:hypothetical protein
MDRFDAMRVFTRIVERRSFTKGGRSRPAALLRYRRRQGIGGATGREAAAANDPAGQPDA